MLHTGGTDILASHNIDFYDDHDLYIMIEYDYTVFEHCGDRVWRPVMLVCGFISANRYGHKNYNTSNELQTN